MDSVAYRTERGKKSEQKLENHSSACVMFYSKACLHTGTSTGVVTSCEILPELCERIASMQVSGDGDLNVPSQDTKGSRMKWKVCVCVSFCFLPVHTHTHTYQKHGGFSRRRFRKYRFHRSFYPPASTLHSPAMEQIARWWWTAQRDR